MSWPFTTGDLVSAADLNTIQSVLAESTATGSSTQVAVSNIAQSHRDMIVDLHGHNAGSVLRTVTVTFNGDTGTNYRWIQTSTADNGTPTRASNTTDTSLNVGVSGDDGGLTHLKLYVPSYSSTRNRSVTWHMFGTAGASAGESRQVTGSGAFLGGAAAITSVQVITGTDNWSSTTTLRAFGVGVL